MSRKIKCSKCQTDLGEIRDATLRTDVVYFCTPCTKPQKTQRDNLFDGIFDDVFDDIFGKTYKR